MDNAPAFQERSLVARDNIGSGISIWKLVLPPGSEPLIEFGNSNRIVVVDSMPMGRTVRSIGKGIIGSSDEVKSRQHISWLEKHAYLYKSNGGKAIGWINEKQASDKTLQISDTDGDIILYVVKATANVISHCTDDVVVEASWASKVLSIFLKYIGKEVCDIGIVEQPSKDANTNNAIPLPDAITLRQLVDSVM